LLITAIEATMGEFVAFDKYSGAGLVDAVAASCAVPATTATSWLTSPTSSAAR
jgi:predicted acylesterase/phospholipase RssA